MHEGHPWWDRSHIKAQELIGQPLVTREAGSMTRQLFETALASHSIELSPHLVLGSREAVKEAVAARIGIGIVLDQELGRDPRLRAIPISDVRITAGEYLVARPETRGLGAVAAFAAMALNTVKEART